MGRRDGVDEVISFLVGVVTAMERGACMMMVEEEGGVWGRGPKGTDVGGKGDPVMCVVHKVIVLHIQREGGGRGI